MRRFCDVAGGVAYRGLKKVATNPQLLLPSLIFPLFFFVAFAGGLSSVGDVPGFDFPSGYTAFQFVFVLLQASAFGGVFTGFGIASDFENGFAQRLMLAAPNRLGILAGYALSAIVRAVVVGVLLFVVALVERDADRRRRRGRLRADHARAAGQPDRGDVGRRAWRCGCGRSRPAR